MTGGDSAWRSDELRRRLDLLDTDGRLAEPQEIAPAVVYLASDAASYATGTNPIIDGGYTSW